MKRKKVRGAKDEYLQRWPQRRTVPFKVVREVKVGVVKIVADGVSFPDQAVVIRWRGEHHSTQVYEGWASFIEVHYHDNTHIEWPQPCCSSCKHWQYPDGHSMGQCWHTSSATYIFDYCENWEEDRWVPT